MVSVYPISPSGHEFYGYSPMMDPTMMRTGLPGSDSLQSESNRNFTIGNVNVNVNKKVRKRYTITKSRESWTEQEHDKFLEALQLFDRDWKKIEAFIGSKTIIQIRSHAQKYFEKVQKSGSNEHVPPPRPKRKASHPYPHKASKNAVFQSSDSTYSNVSAVSMPDFTEVYSFIGSLFDPNGIDHFQRLKKMDPINVQTVLMLMKNLTANLISPEFENHRRIISSNKAIGSENEMVTCFKTTYQEGRPGIGYTVASV